MGNPQKSFSVLAIAYVVCIVALTTVAAQQGKPDGQGANACHLLFAGGTIPNAGAALVIGGDKYNVGNPESVLIAGDCDGGPISLIDDGLTMTVTHPNGDSGVESVNFYNFCGGSNNGGPAIDVTHLFKSGTHHVELTLDNDCGGDLFAPPLFLVVRQHSN
jgi:hypothetical protein